MPRLLINKFNWWISNDPNVWWPGSLYNAEWVEIRENSKSVTLSKWNVSTNSISSLDTVVWYNYYDNIHFLRLHSSWRICDISKNDPDNWNYIVDLSGSAYNIWNLTTPIWNRGFIITSSNLYQWNYDWVNYSSLWIYLDNSTWIISNWDFSTSTWWTVWAWWAISWWQATHTAWWWTAGLSYTSTNEIWKKYRIEVRCWNITADSCQLRIWWVSVYTFSSTDSNKTVVFIYTAIADNEVVEFVPFTWFAWSFNNIEWQWYNITAYTKAFNEKAPFITIQNFIYIGNWNKITEIDTTTDTWQINDVLTIDLGYTIKGISKIGDQVYIYASNWSSTKQYIWNWVDTSVNVSITWIDKNCINVANWANQDYIITKSLYSNKTSLYIVNWYQLQNIFTNSENQNSSLERIFFNPNKTNAIETIWYKLLIPWDSWIYSYWQFTPWLPMSLVKEYLHNWWEITAMYYSEANSQRLVYSYYWTINWVSWVYENLVQFYWGYPYRSDLSWFIELHPQSWECVSNIKNLEKLTIGYKLQTWTSLNIYTKNNDRTTQYATITYNYTTIPTVWAVYTTWWNTYTVLSVTDLSNYCLLHCSYTWTATILDWTFTKSSWTGDASFYSNKVRSWYKLEGSISDTTKRRETFNTPEQYNELQVWIEFLTNSSTYTPTLNDINIYYNEVTND